MKYTLTLPILLLLFVFSISSAQQTSSSIDTSYGEYFQDSREIPYLHLNKTVFLRGEEIWFQAYVLNQNSKKLHEKTTNLYVSIFNQEGALKDQRLIYIDKGIGKGNILLDSTFTRKKYFIKASTNWMRNFNEDQSFVQEITIVNSKEEPQKTSTLKKDAFFDFQVFPEGGHLLEEVTNTLGILIKDKNGNGQLVTNGILKDKKGATISTFNTNSMGIGSITYFYDKGENYTLTATLENGSEVTKSVPKAKEYGVALNVYNPGTPLINITLNTNTSTLGSLIGKTYRIWIHNTSSYYKMNVSFQPKNNTYSILVKKENLSKGVNIITVFDEKNQPILERLIFNYDDSLFQNVLVKSSKSTDSLKVDFRGVSNEKVYLSASFLPGQTKAYTPSNSLYTAFLLKPYVKGNIENPHYYFTNTNRKKLGALDNLLLTQGWSKYSWNKIFSKPNQLNFKFESGITVNGKLNKRLKKGERLMAFSKENNLLDEVAVSNNGFTFSNYIFRKNSKIDFALQTKKRILRIKPVLQYSSTPLKQELDVAPLVKNNAELEITGFQSLMEERKLLDEIRLATKRREYKNKPYGGNSILTGYKMKDRINANGETILNFLREKRFNVSTTGGDVQITSGRRGVQRTRTNLVENDDGTFSTVEAAEIDQPARFKSGSVRVFLDDVDITNSLWLLESMYLNAVEEVFFGQLTDTWSAQQIYIYSASPQAIAGNKNPFQSVLLNHGFEKTKEYYQPQYPSYLNDTYLRYGTIFWKPNIVLDKSKTYQLEIPKNLQKHIVMYLEGVSESGKLFSKRVLLKN